MASERLILTTLFRGIFWDAGWEFDAPCILYWPCKRYGIGGNSHHLDSMVEDICIDLTLGKQPAFQWSESDLKEFKWRGWSPRGFANRKQAWHVEIGVAWNANGVNFSISHKERWGKPEGRKT